MVRWLGFAAGLVLLLSTASSVLKTLLIPRSSSSVYGSALAWAVRETFQKITARVEDLRQRERILAASGPAWLISLLVTWLVSLLLGFALVLWPMKQGGFPVALEESGSSIFTLGFVRPSGPAPTGIVFLAAASGLALVAMLIAYLPVLYAAFNRREILVTTLEALAGAPAWGPELLSRQALIGDVAYLPKVYERWTEWAADISESHTNYRTLVAAQPARGARRRRAAPGLQPQYRAPRSPAAAPRRLPHDAQARPRGAHHGERGSAPG